jgi:hypothetical protein
MIHLSVKPFIHLLRLLACLALSGVLAAGCGGSGGDASGGGASASQTLTVATGDDVKSLDPALAFDTWSTAIVHAFTRRLVL